MGRRERRGLGLACVKLGPNGGLIYCMEYLIDKIDWLQAKPANSSWVREAGATPCAGMGSKLLAVRWSLRADR